MAWSDSQSRLERLVVNRQNGNVSIRPTTSRFLTILTRADVELLPNEQYINIDAEWNAYDLNAISNDWPTYVTELFEEARRAIIGFRPFMVQFFVTNDFNRTVPVRPIIIEENVTFRRTFDHMLDRSLSALNYVIEALQNPTGQLNEFVEGQTSGFAHVFANLIDTLNQHRGFATLRIIIVAAGEPGTARTRSQNRANLTPSAVRNPWSVLNTRRGSPGSPPRMFTPPRSLSPVSSIESLPEDAARIPSYPSAIQIPTRPVRPRAPILPPTQRAPARFPSMRAPYRFRFPRTGSRRSKRLWKKRKGRGILTLDNGLATIATELWRMPSLNQSSILNLWELRI